MRNITFQEFQKHLKDIQKIDRLHNKIREAVKGSEMQMVFPDLRDNVIELLALATNDTYGAIDAWVYQLDFGKLYVDGCVRDDKTGENIKMKSVQDLWNYLCESNVNKETEHGSKT